MSQIQESIPTDDTKVRKKLAYHLSHSLIREYLSFHGQKEVLDVFDKYNERTTDSILKRSQISKHLSLSRRHTSNPEESKESSFLERLILDRLQKIQKAKNRSLAHDSSKKKRSEKDKDIQVEGRNEREELDSKDSGLFKAPLQESIITQSPRSSHSLQKNTSSKSIGHNISYVTEDYKTSVSEHEHHDKGHLVSKVPFHRDRLKSRRSSRQSKTDGLQDERASSKSSRKTGTKSSKLESFHNERSKDRVGSWDFEEEAFSQTSNIGAHKKEAKRAPHIELDDDDMMFEDVNFDPNMNLERTTSLFSRRKPIEIGSTLGQKIRNLIIGTTKLFDKAWLEQGFSYSKVEDAAYGIVQHEGGSCGVIAVVQAYVLKELYHVQNIDHPPSKSQLKETLIESLANILHTINSQKVIISIGTRSTDYSNPDISFSKFIYYESYSRSETLDIIRSNYESFSDPYGLGALQLMVSAILTRSIENVLKDMDFQTNTMIVEYGYCSQELVNLLLIGTATSNVFDGMKVIGSRHEKTYLKGIQRRSEIGFISLMESYNYINVGENYKFASHYVWVVFSESHYSVLFSKDNGPSQENFVLYYWDSLANQDEEIALSISRTGESQILDMTEDSMIPPLNRCIWTLWNDVKIEWSCEPLY